MPLTDLAFPVTAKRVGPSATVLSRPRVVYLKSSDLFQGPFPAINSGNAVLKTGPRGNRKIEVYETPDEFLGMQALSQGATGSQVFTKIYGVLAPTASATGADGTVPVKYYNEIAVSVVGNYVRLPDPFVRRLVVLQNLTTGSITVNGRGTTTTINGATGVYTVHSLERAHFLAPTAATAGTTAPWQVARDVGQA